MEHSRVYQKARNDHKSSVEDYSMYLNPDFQSLKGVYYSINSGLNLIPFFTSVFYP